MEQNKSFFDVIVPPKTLKPVCPKNIGNNETFHPQMFVDPLIIPLSRVLSLLDRKQICGLCFMVTEQIYKRERHLVSFV